MRSDRPAPLDHRLGERLTVADALCLHALVGKQLAPEVVRDIQRCEYDEREVVIRLDALLVDFGVVGPDMDTARGWALECLFWFVERIFEGRSPVTLH